MNNAYFDYSPVGESLLVLEIAGNEPREISLNLQGPTAMVEAIASFVQQNNVNYLYCNGSGIGLADGIKMYLLKNYNYTNCEISQYC